MRLTATERFWSYIVKGPAPEDCGLWTGAISDDGYGRLWRHDGARQKALRPQRYAYELAIGQLLPSDVVVLHSCDVPTCVHADVDPHVSHVRERSGCALRAEILDHGWAPERRVPTSPGWKKPTLDCSELRPERPSRRQASPLRVTTDQASCTAVGLPRGTKRPRQRAQSVPGAAPRDERTTAPTVRWVTPPSTRNLGTE